MVLLVRHECTVIAKFFNENIWKNSDGYTNDVGRIKVLHKLNFALTSRSRHDHNVLSGRVSIMEARCDRDVNTM